MPSPFPGMNPYLENPELWSEVHHRLITAIADAIESDLTRDYRVAIEKRSYLSEGESVLVGIPDVSVLSQRSTISQNPSTTISAPLVDLQSLLFGVYERARYDLAIDYSLELVPPLQEEDKIWVDVLLREKGLR